MSNWLCFGAFLSPPTFSLRLHWPLATILSPLATRHYLPPSAGPSGVRSCADPPPLATACHRLPNCERSNGPDLAERTLYSYYTPNQAIPAGKSNPFPPTRRRPTVDHSLVAGGAQRQWLQACLPDGHQPQCPPLYVPSAHKHLSQKASTAVAAILEKKTIADASNRVYDQRCAKLSIFTPLLVSRATKSPPGWPSSLPSRGRP